MPLLVARIGRPLGLRGEVTVQVHTDDPLGKLVKGARFDTDPPGAGPLTVRNARAHHGVSVLAFEGVLTREDAEALRGTRLLLDQDIADGQADAWYEEQLVGLRVEDTAGTALGTVAALRTRPAQDLLVIDLAGGRQALVPFVAALVPLVEPAAGRIVIDAPPGLLDLESS